MRMPAREGLADPTPFSPPLPPPWSFPLSKKGAGGGMGLGWRGRAAARACAGAGGHGGRGRARARARRRADGHLREVQVDDEEEGEVQQLKVVHQVVRVRSQRRRHRAEEQLRRVPRTGGGGDGLAGRGGVVVRGAGAGVGSRRTLNAASAP